MGRIHVYFVSLILIVTSFCRVTYSDSVLGNCIIGDITFNCSGIGLTELPTFDHIPDSTEILDFSNNRISNISFLEYTALDSLSTLFLQNNQIANIEGSSFAKLATLVELDLSRNLISGKKMDEMTFEYLKRLRRLIMERNPIRYLVKNTFNFMELPAINYLDISHCEISEIEESAIDLPSLLYLDLSWNMLKSFKKESFKMLVALHILDMSHNQLKVLDEVPYLPEVSTWILDNNLIEVVAISDGVWNMADSLQKLSLRHNNIMRFGDDSFPLDLDTLTKIDLYNNRIQCNCWMRWLVGGHYDFKDKNYTIQCEYPHNLKGHNLLEIPPNELKCGIPLAQILLLSGLVLIALVSCVLLAFFVIRKRKRRTKTTKKSAKRDGGGDYTAVYTRDNDDVTVNVSDKNTLLNNEREFDV